MRYSKLAVDFFPHFNAKTKRPETNSKIRLQNRQKIGKILGEDSPNRRILKNHGRQKRGMGSAGQTEGEKQAGNNRTKKDHGSKIRDQPKIRQKTEKTKKPKEAKTGKSGNAEKNQERET